MLVTALMIPHDDALSEDAGTEQILKRIGAGRSRWASFTIDLDAISQWLDNHIDKRPEGMGLGNQLSGEDDVIIGLKLKFAMFV
ncbi:hypothetical protein M408DRAFT_30194 [Serendipita vermifera MAFF 305830]|uniref:Uncharacterized protein n=1 Tax=Serendipita vermifera MAFF 305830 TaxID=933852 RepID=A0A0C3AKV3_SERVB|nr:hypothetical protein M408DRAFT_30194 [Serendipita vermifera MAFF 305830]